MIFGICARCLEDAARLILVRARASATTDLSVLRMRLLAESIEFYIARGRAGFGSESTWTFTVPDPKATPCDSTCILCRLRHASHKRCRHCGMEGSPEDADL